MKLKVRRTFEAQTKTKPLIDSAGRPEAVPYIQPLGRLCACRGRCPPSPRLIQMAFPFIAGRSAARVQPSQSPSVTAPPEGDMPMPALERPCLSPRERWQRREPLTERDVGGDAHIAPQHKNNAVIICGTSGGRPLHSSSRKVCACRGRCPASPALFKWHFLLLRDVQPPVSSPLSHLR